jgi:hypothetical protein
MSYNKIYLLQPARKGAAKFFLSLIRRPGWTAQATWDQVAGGSELRPNPAEIVQVAGSRAYPKVDGMISQSLRTCVGSLIGCLVLTTSGLAQEREAERSVSTHAAVGQTIKIRGHVNYTHNCTEVIPTAISVVHPPQYGSLDMRDEVVRSGDPELGHGSKCALSSGLGKVVYYTRKAPGTDVFAYDSVSMNGVVHVHATVK